MSDEGTRLLRIAARVPREAAAQARRGARWLRQRRRLPAGVRPQGVFVVGCQRSGTNMLMWTLERSPDVWVWHEHKLSAAFRDYRLRPTANIERLIASGPAPVVAFKPVCDAHLTDRLLERHPGSRAVWIFRGHTDVANSAVRNFGEHMRDIVRWIARGDTDLLGWRGERLAPDVVDLVREVDRDDLPLEDASALFWYMRNRFFFDLGLDRNPRTLLVRYEDLVTGGEAAFARVFSFLETPFDPAFLEGLFSDSVGKNAFPEIDPRIQRACDELEARLVAAYEGGTAGDERRSAGPGDAAPGRT